MGEAAFDLAALEQRLDGDRELVLDVIRLFLEDCPLRLRAIRDACDAGDMPGLQQAAHSLKGAAAYLEAAAVVEAARQLETAGRDGRGGDALEMLARVEQEAAVLAGQLRATPGV